MTEERLKEIEKIGMSAHVWTTAVPNMLFIECTTEIRRCHKFIDTMAVDIGFFRADTLDTKKEEA